MEEEELLAATQQVRVRQACEPCRRKKTRCPGERPICSFCQRLNQPCEYKRKDPPGRISKDGLSQGRGSKARVQRLESQVEHLFGVIQTLTETRSRDLTHPQLQNETPDVSLHLTPDNAEIRSGSALGGTTLHFDPSRCPQPPPEVIEHLIEVYKTRLHLQPLPLFNPDVLLNQLSQFPWYLLYSFLAVTVHFTNHPFFQNQEHTAIKYYVDLARETLIPKVTEGKSSLEVVQSLCLLGLSDILDCKLARAWVNIGIASRLAICRRSLRTEYPENYWSSRDDESRCYWSVVMLEQIFGSGECNLLIGGSGIARYPYPSSVANPLVSGASDLLDGISSPAPSTPPEQRDLGITAYCIQLLSIWSRIVSYTREMRLEFADSWLPASSYHKLITELYGFETTFPQKHRFNHASFEKERSRELAEQNTYWSAWLLLQVTYHTAHALLNHPILHIVQTRKQRPCQPPSFLQLTVDEAILHSSWTARLLRICEDLEFEINNPFIGHLATVAASVDWIFQLAGEKTVSENARHNFSMCQQFVRKISRQWPHLSHSVQRLEHLQSIFNTRSASTTNQSFIPSPELALHWELLDQSVSIVTLDNAVPNSESIKSQVTTRYLAPLTEPSVSQESIRPASVHPDIHPQNTNSSTDFVHDAFTQDLHDDGLFGDIDLSDISRLQFSPSFNHIFGQL